MNEKIKKGLFLAIVDQAVKDYLHGPSPYFYSAENFIKENNLWEYVERKKKKPIPRHLIALSSNCQIHVNSFTEFKKMCKMLSKEFGPSSYSKVPTEGFWYSASRSAMDELRRA